MTESMFYGRMACPRCDQPARIVGTKDAQRAVCRPCGIDWDCTQVIGPYNAPHITTRL